MIRKAFIRLLVILEMSCLIDADASENLFFEHFNMENGLSQNTVNCIVQDDDGFMWFGTKDGLNRFDGLNFKIYRHVSNDVNSLGSSYILSLCKDSDGVLWVGTDLGLYVYDVIYDNFRPLPAQTGEDENVPKRINNMKADKNGDVWLAAGQQGLYKYNKSDNRLYNYALQDSAYVQCVEIDGKGRVWAGTLNDGLFFLNRLKGEFEKYETKGIDLSQCSPNVLLSSGDWMYVGTFELGLLVLTDEGSLQEIENRSEDIKLNATLIHDIERKSASEILIGTEIGLIQYNEVSKKSRRYYHHVFDSRSISDNAIYSIYKDKENGIWIGTYFDGINYFPYRFSPFKQYYPQQDYFSISGERVRELCQDNRGHLWVGTEDNGLSCFDIEKQEFVTYERKRVGRSPDLSNVHGLACDDTYLWIGYYNGGMDRYDLSTGELQYMSLSQKMGHKVNEDIFSLYCSQTDRKLWIGTVTGVYTYDIKEDELRFVNDLGGLFVYDIMQDQEGYYWFATLGSGVIRYHPGTKKCTFYVYDENDEFSLPSNKVLSSHVSSTGDVWFTTEGGGICRYNPEKDNFIRFDEKSGIPGVVYQIVEDFDANFWFGTNSGLVKLDTETGHVQTYTRNNGLISNQFNYKSGSMDTNGVIYFGTVKGMIAFDPKTFAENDYKPTIAFTSFSVFNKEVEIGTNSPLKQSINTTESITLRHDQSTIAFEFVVLSFSSPQQNRYAYKMDGLDKDWNLLERGNRIYYSNLPPGDYVFRVKGANSYGIWCEEGKNLDIHILPPFYLSLAARILYFFFAFLLLCGIYVLQKKRFYNKHKQQIATIEREKEKEAIKAKIDFFTNVTHEIRTPLTLISSPLEYLLEDKELKGNVRENLLVMQQNTKRLLQLSNQLLDFQRVENKKYQLSFADTNITQTLKDTYNRFFPTAKQRSLNCSLVVPDEAIWAKVDGEAFVKILSNLFANAVKYAFTYIKVELKLADNDSNFLLVVENDGHLVGENMKDKIFEPFYQIKDGEKGYAGNGSGLGLPLARGLAQMHAGTLTYQLSPDGMANCFILQLPLGGKENNPSNMEATIQPNEASESHVADSPLLKKRKIILLVEDNVDLLELMTKWLASDYVILKAQNGLTALQQLENKDVDLIISDIMMPELDGLGLLKEVKSNYRFSHIPFIFLTAKNNLDSKIESLDLGADAYVEKPFSFSHLKAQITNLLEKREEVKRLFNLYPIDAINTLGINDTDQRFLSSVNQVIENNLDNSELNIDFLSEELGMSRSTLNRKFKGLSELSPNEYIRLYRLKKAAVYLKSGKYRINEVAFLTGFSTSSYFAKCFQKQYGVLPKEYINIHKAE